MFLLAISVICLTTVLVFLVKLARLAGQRSHIIAHEDERSDWPLVSVIIPARNEAANITKSLGSMLAQDYPADKLEIIVVDDDSEDETRAIAEQLIKGTAFDARVISGRSLPKGWLGKSNACMWGSMNAKGEYLFFVDADTESEPALLKSIIDFSQQRDIELLSFNPQQEMLSFSEKSLLPGVFLSTANSMDFVASNTEGKDEAIANGQAMLFLASAYHAENGHDLVKADISEDLAFAEKFKRRGHRIYWAFADSLMRTRMYTNAQEVWDGFSKNMHRIVKAPTFIQASWYWFKCQWIAWLAPVLLVVSTLDYLQTPSDLALWTLGVNAVTIVALIATFIGLVRELFVPIHYAIFVPVGISLNGFLTLNALRLHKLNRVTWKNRSISQ
ncbi:glycosyltransferase [Vibrio agarivorans]|uniref:Glycosyltransferase n=1 Tax=Vibrio agarivorans TaxID=153622 RepID=A0ABT7XYW4_9VIBR|nr:glycosyltransferase [Vibrio agarivorans]MDN2480974.1 glycosyltransferase [Vibrio agarivorans]